MKFGEFGVVVIYVWGAKVEYNAYFLILEINFLILEIHFLILENDFLILENQFLILENEILILQIEFLISKNNSLIFCFIFCFRKLISNIRKYDSIF